MKKRLSDVIPLEAREYAAAQEYKQRFSVGIEGDSYMVRRDECGYCVMENALLFMGVPLVKEHETASPGGGMILEIWQQNPEEFLLPPPNMYSDDASDWSALFWHIVRAFDAGEQDLRKLMELD